MQRQFWSRVWKAAHWTRLLSGPTYARLTLDAGAEQWIASLRDSRAKTSVSPVSAPGLMAPVPGSSSKFSASPTIAVRGQSFWRTWQASLLPPPPLWTRPKASSTNARPPASWENWPTAGGMRNGSLFQRPKWAPAISGTGGSASRGDQWLTPNVPNGGRHVPEELVGSKGMTAEGQKRTVGLESQTKYWATPKANDAEKRGNVTLRPGLPELVGQAQSWPTPAARDGKGANSETHCTLTGGGRKHMDQLANFVAYSPLAQQISDGPPSSPSTPSSPRRLNPIFASWLMGWPSTWVIADPRACGASEMELYRCRLQQHLSCLLGDLECSYREAA